MKKYTLIKSTPTYFQYRQTDFFRAPKLSNIGHGFGQVQTNGGKEHRNGFYVFIKPKPIPPYLIAIYERIILKSSMQAHFQSRFNYRYLKVQENISSSVRSLATTFIPYLLLLYLQLSSNNESVFSTFPKISCMPYCICCLLFLNDFYQITRFINTFASYLELISCKINGYNIVSFCFVQFYDIYKNR